MNIINNIKHSEFKSIIYLIGLTGFVGGFQILSNGPKFYVKGIFGFFGMLIGITVGILALLILNKWEANKRQKVNLILTYVLFSIAPMIWIYLDFPEKSNSNTGFISMLIIDFVALIRLYFVLNKKSKILFYNIFIVVVWQIIISYWFITVTWKTMGYWD